MRITSCSVNESMPRMRKRVRYVDDQGRKRGGMIEITITEPDAVADWLASDATENFCVIALLRKLA